MRKYIFTEHEREVLTDWLAGKRTRREIPVDSILDRVQKHKENLFDELLFYTLFAEAEEGKEV